MIQPALPHSPSNKSIASFDADIPNKPAPIDLEPAPPPPRPLPVTRSRSAKAFNTVKHHFAKHVGAGLIASVAYFDPGNWSVDLQAGSQYGYKLLFVVLLSGLGAALLQSLATRLGCVTGQNLAQHCRLLLHDRPKHKLLYRWLLLYPLYALAELAIVATDLAELLGSAIALVLLIPSLPLWAGVLITAADVFVILLISDPGRSTKPVRIFEILIAALVMIVFFCFIILLVKVKPHWGPVFLGFLPSSALVRNGALYICIGILGATVMPHALFLGSFLATQDRVGSSEETLLPAPIAPRRRGFLSYVHSLFALTKVDGYEGPTAARLPFIKAHLNHGIFDMVASLLGLAVFINSAILILAGTVFFDPTSSTDPPASLFDAYDLIVQRLGKGAGILFAVALLAAGQSATITATLSGQVVSEGYIAWRMSPFLTRLTTRTIALVPATIVAAVVGKDGINALLVASQVVLSLILPFIVFPLVWFTSNPRIMTIPGKVAKDGSVAPSTSFTNNIILKILGYIIFIIIVLADGAALISLFLGAA